MSSEYGWQDETIMDLPLVRLRQITAAIQQRRFLEARREGTQFSWLARTLSSFIAGGYMVEGNNPALDAAQEIAFDDIERALLGSPTQLSTPSKAPVGNDGKALDIDPNEAIQRALAKNSNGSFERFMTMDHSLKQRGKMI